MLKGSIFLARAVALTAALLSAERGLAQDHPAELGESKHDTASTYSVDAGAGRVDEEASGWELSDSAALLLPAAARFGNASAGATGLSSPIAAPVHAASPPESIHDIDVPLGDRGQDSQWEASLHSRHGSLEASHQDGADPRHAQHVNPDKSFEPAREPFSPDPGYSGALDHDASGGAVHRVAAGVIGEAQKLLGQFRGSKGVAAYWDRAKTGAIARGGYRGLIGISLCHTWCLSDHFHGETALTRASGRGLEMAGAPSLVMVDTSDKSSAQADGEKDLRKLRVAIGSKNKMRASMSLKRKKIGFRFYLRF